MRWRTITIRQHSYKIKDLYTLTSEHQINMTAGSHFNPDINYALHETHKDILQQHQNISTPTAKEKMKRIYLYDLIVRLASVAVFIQKTLLPKAVFIFLSALEISNSIARPVLSKG